jgi:predicted RNA-binding Zn ribbon-like protein
MQVSLDDYSWGARVATELVNTAPGVWSGVDKLPDPAALDLFLAEHRVVPDPGGARAAGPDDLDAVRHLRDAVRALIDDPDPDRLVAGATALSTSVGALTLAADGSGRRHWHALTRSDADLAEHLALVCAVGVLGVVHTLGAERFRPCASTTCSGAFIDTTRPGRRRYCMPDLCGNRVNVANHRARQAR